MSKYFLQFLEKWWLQRKPGIKNTIIHYFSHLVIHSAWKQSLQIQKIRTRPSFKNVIKNLIKKRSYSSSSHDIEAASTWPSTVQEVKKVHSPLLWNEKLQFFPNKAILNCSFFAFGMRMRIFWIKVEVMSCAKVIN